MKTLYKTVQKILSEVQSKGDKALCGFAAKFDGVRITPSQLRLAPAEIKAARQKISPAFQKALAQCAANIRAFALAEKRALAKNWTVRQGTIRLGQQFRPVDSVGIYIPGGRYPYPSTVLMTTIPAIVAGVKRIAIVTPPKNLTPEVLAAADFVGCAEIYRVGGAGAIAALAYGTKTIRPVDFIVGPGNAFVTEAKRQVFGRVGIDSLAGPSEVVIIADRTTSIDAILADLQAQAEHDPDSQGVLLTPDSSVITEVKKRIDPALAERVIFRRTANLQVAFDAANEYAAEHLEVLLKKPERYLNRIRHAGAIFLGPATTAVLGDYVAGPSHVLPTAGAARFASGLSVATFMKRSSVIAFAGKTSERKSWEAALTMANTEGMPYHAQSLRVRVAGGNGL
jgi:histidinol dehydrogenase